MTRRFATMTDTLARMGRIDDHPSVARQPAPISDVIERKRQVHSGAQYPGEIVYYEQPEPRDGIDCVLVAIIAIADGGQVRVPILRNVGANLAGAITKALA